MRRSVDVLRFCVGSLALAGLCALGTLAAWAVVYPAVRGWTPVAVTSGSMQPALRTGDILLAAPTDPDWVVPGSIVVFDDPTGSGFVTHRVVGRTDDGELSTKGDYNAFADSTPVADEQVLGVGSLIVPLVGRPHAWASDGDWASLALGTIALTTALWCARWAVFEEFDPWRSAVVA